MSEVNQVKARVSVEAKMRNMTISEVARRCGRSPQALQDILNRGNPRLETLQEIAGALGVSIDQLLVPVTAEEYGAAHMPTST